MSDKQWRERYDEYRNTDQWAHLRSLKFATSGRMCVFCKSGKDLDPHHLRYRNFTDCTVDDLVILCRTCHKHLHAKLRASGMRIGDVDSEAKVCQFLNDYAPKPSSVNVRPKSTFQAECLLAIATAKRDLNRRSVADLIVKLQAALQCHEIRTRTTSGPSEMMTLTEEHIQSLRSAKGGGLTVATVKALGLKHKDMSKGWLKRLVGTSISSKDYEAAMNGRYITKNGKPLEAPMEAAEV